MDINTFVIPSRLSFSKIEEEANKYAYRNKRNFENPLTIKEAKENIESIIQRISGDVFLFLKHNITVEEIDFNNLKENFENSSIQLNDASGCVCIKYEKNNQTVYTNISYNEEDTEQKQLFTLFHELGHLKFHIFDNDELISQLIETQEPLVINQKGEGLVESQANIFSANYLSPVDEIINFINASDSIDVSSITEHFNVFPQVINNQIKNHIDYIRRKI